MQIRTPIERATSSINPKPALRYVHFNRQKMRLEATTGHIAAIVPVNPSEIAKSETGGLIPIEAIIAAHKVKGVLNGTVLLSKNSVTIPGGWSFPRPNAKGPAFPNIEAVIPADLDSILSQRPTLTFDVHLLSTLASAIGSNGKIDLWVQPIPGKPLIIKDAITSNDALGLIMPCQSVRPIPEPDNA